METDIPLRALTAACAADLLPLLGEPDADVLEVHSFELPATATRLDNLLRLWDPRARRAYLHLVEWQGYRDLHFLWRALGYLGWLGQHRDERPIHITLIYLHPGDDVGAALPREGDGAANWGVTFHCIRLWEEDAAEAVRSGSVGLAVLSPLMGGATAPLVEEAARVVLAATEEPEQQKNLLSILGILAEPLVAPDRFVAMLGKERLMASQLVEYLQREWRAEREEQWARERAQIEQERAQALLLLEQERAQREQERAQRERERAQREQEQARIVAAATLMRTVEEAIAVRFPAAPLALAAGLHRIQDPQALQELLLDILRAADLASVERAIAARIP